MEETKTERKKINYLPTLLSVGSLVGFLLFVPPDEDNFLLSLVPMVLLWMTVYFGVGTLLEYINRAGKVLSRILRISSASVSVLIVMFSALGQLSVLDVIALVSLVTLGSFYFDRTWRG